MILPNEISDEKSHRKFPKKFRQNSDKMDYGESCRGFSTDFFLVYIRHLSNTNLGS